MKTFLILTLVCLILPTGSQAGSNAHSLSGHPLSGLEGTWITNNNMYCTSGKEPRLKPKTQLRITVSEDKQDPDAITIKGDKSLLDLECLPDYNTHPKGPNSKGIFSSHYQFSAKSLDELTEAPTLVKTFQNLGQQRTEETYYYLNGLPNGLKIEDLDLSSLSHVHNWNALMCNPIAWILLRKLFPEHMAKELQQGYILRLRQNERFQLIYEEPDFCPNALTVIEFERS